MQASDNQDDEKFFFHMNNFDDDVIEEEEFEEPPPPVFSEAELDQAKRQSYTKGHEEGLAEAKASRDQQISNTLQRIAAETQTLFTQETAREKTYEREAVALSLSIFKKLFPVFQSKYGFEEMQGQLESIIQSQEGQSAIQIKTSTDFAPDIEAYMQELSSKNDALSFKVVGDEAMANGDIALSWADGGAIRHAEHMAQEIESKLQEVLAGLAPNSHDRGDVDSPPEAENAEPAEQDITQADAEPEEESATPPSDGPNEDDKQVEDNQ